MNGPGFLGAEWREGVSEPRVLGGRVDGGERVSSAVSSTVAVFCTPGRWWSTLDPTVFQRLVGLYKEVVVYLLKMHKVGIPQAEQRIFTCFLHTSLRLLEILHAVGGGNRSAFVHRVPPVCPVFSSTPSLETERCRVLLSGQREGGTHHPV